MTPDVFYAAAAAWLAAQLARVIAADRKSRRDHKHALAKLANGGGT